MKKMICFVLVIAVFVSAGCFPFFSETASAEENERVITLSGRSAEFNCSGVSVEGSVITITEVAEYTITGTLDDGRIIIDTGASQEKISITLDNVNLTCLTDSVIYVAQAEKVKLYMAEGTENVITSGTEDLLATFDDSRSGAAIYAEDDFDIKGPGVLIVNGYINNGITCKDDIDIDGGTIIINAANNGIKGSESVEINDGNLTINAGNDALKATSTKVEKGYVEINGGNTLLTADGNGISAASYILVTGGETVINSLKKPIKAGGKIDIAAGSLIANGEKV